MILLSESRRSEPGRERPINATVYPPWRTTRGTRELLSIRTISGYLVMVRSIQYSRIANFLAAATFATPFALLWQRCKYSLRNSGSWRTAACAASTSNIRRNELPCLLIDPAADVRPNCTPAESAPDNWPPACRVENAKHLPWSVRTP